MQVVRGLAFLSASLVVALAACATSVDVDPDETTIEPGPTAEFDPGSGVLPLPTNLVLDPTTGKLALPEQCNESASATAIREGILNTLDGFGTFKVVLRATFSAPLDMSTVDDRVFLFRVQRGGQPDDPTAAEPVPVVVQPSATVRYDADCANPTEVDALVIVPRVPLDDGATYAVAVLEGIETASGEPLRPSVVWSLVRQTENPVAFEGDVVVRNLTPFNPTDPAGLASLRGLDQLWTYHAAFLPFLDGALAAQTGAAVPRDQLLLAWSFNTQTVERPLDPAADGPASTLATATTNDTTPVAFQEGATGEQVMDAALCGAQGQAAGCGVCTVVPCAAVGQVLTGTITSPSYQVPMGPVPTVWNNPIAPTMQSEASLPYLAFVPAGEAPDEGYPVVVFGHGLTGSKSNLFAIASQLAAAGVASIAIDHVAHGDRAVRISTDGACAGEQDPSARPDCFAPFLSNNFAVARDNIRQSVIDQLKLIEVLKACGVNECGALSVDEDRIGYMGQSLGALIGATTVSVSGDVAAAVLNVGGVGWVDVAINTDTDALICPVIDSLIDAGVLSGTRWDGGANDDALCLDRPAWQGDPAFQSFANTARWVYDPADGANFTDRLRTRGAPVLVQKVVGDRVVPNVATDQLGGLLGLTPTAANVAPDAGSVTPTAAATAEASGWIDYQTTGGNAYQHASLLAPSAEDGGALGTQQMQTDAITFLVRNL